MTKILKIGGLALAIMALTSVVAHVKRISTQRTTDEELAETTAMITNLKGNSGGTGVVIQSSNSESTVLTNAHVCQVVKNGGLVTTDSKRAAVSSYKVSKMHDLCLISVKSNLNVNTAVAKTAPTTYSSAAVAGHPALLPTLVTRGHFGSHEIITILSGFRECTEDDYKDENLSLICAFMGYIPILKNFESQVISSTIMPGSSGSAVFNSKGEIAGMVFAGSGQLSYGHIVPQEYVQYFLETESKWIAEEIPNMESSNKETKARNTFVQTCLEGQTNENYQKIAVYCKYLELDLLK